MNPKCVMSGCPNQANMPLRVPIRVPGPVTFAPGKDVATVLVCPTCYERIKPALRAGDISIEVREG